MAMVISPRSKIVTLSLLIGIITLVALIITGVIGIWHKSEKPTKPGTKMVSSKLQQITGYTATKHVSRNFLFVAATCPALNSRAFFTVGRFHRFISDYWTMFIDMVIFADSEYQLYASVVINFIIYREYVYN